MDMKQSEKSFLLGLVIGTIVLIFISIWLTYRCIECKDTFDYAKKMENYEEKSERPVIVYSLTKNVAVD